MRSWSLTVRNRRHKVDTRSLWVYVNASLHLPALTTYVNVLSVILVSYHLFLLLLLLPHLLDDDSTVDEMAERYKVGVNAREGENVARKKRGYRERKEDTRRGEEEEGPAFQSPVSTRDPRPLNHPPQLGRNSVLFSPLLCSFLLFFSLRVFHFFYLSSLPFLIFSTGPRRQPTDPPPPPSSSSSTLPMFLRHVLMGENCGKNVVDLRDRYEGDRPW